MTFAWTIVALLVLLAIAWRFLGSYMAAVFEGRTRWRARMPRSPRWPGARSNRAR